MTLDENILDILRYAYMQEVRAAIFYERLAERTPLAHVSRKLAELAETEKHHQRCVAQWYEQAAGKKPMCTLSGGRIEGSGAFDASPVSLEEVMTMAIQAEKRAEGFYRKWAERAKTEQERDLLELMADQERDHVIVLTEERVAQAEPMLSLAGIVMPWAQLLEREA